MECSKCKDFYGECQGKPHYEPREIAANRCRQQVMDFRDNENTQDGTRLPEP